MTSSWFFLSTLNYDARSTTHQIYIKQKILIFERNILRRIFGPTQRASREWRLKTNEELEKVINNENIIRYMKYKRLSWLGHVERMTNERVAKTIYKWKPYATRPKEVQE